MLRTLVTLEKRQDIVDKLQNAGMWEWPCMHLGPHGPLGSSRLGPAGIPILRHSELLEIVACSYSSTDLCPKHLVLLAVSFAIPLDPADRKPIPPLPHY